MLPSIACMSLKVSFLMLHGKENGSYLFILGLFHSCFGFVAALTVYISILEQQAKYLDALEVLRKLGSLIMIEVDRLRIEVFSEAFPSPYFRF